MRPKCIYIDSTLFTENNVPFQLSDDEEIFYFHKDVQLYLRLGNGVPIETEVYKASGGHIFLTKYRLIYKVVNSENNFNSFCLPLKEIVGISENNTVDFIYGTLIQSIYLDLCDAQKSVFFDVLRNLLRNFNPRNFEEDIENLPFYSDLYK